MQRSEIIDSIEVSPTIKLKARIIFMGKDLVICIGGGEEHIGSISFATTNEQHCWVDPPHKERIITDMVRDIFKDKFPESRVAVIGGIHYDSILISEIDMIIDKCRKWARQASSQIAAEKIL